MYMDTNLGSYCVSAYESDNEEIPQSNLQRCEQ